MPMSKGHGDCWFWLVVETETEHRDSVRDVMASCLNGGKRHYDDDDDVVEFSFMHVLQRIKPLLCRPLMC